MARLDGRTAVITGAGGGYGGGMARRFAAEGARVICVDIDADAASRIAAEVGGIGLQCDISDGASVKAMVAAALAASTCS